MDKLYNLKESMIDELEKYADKPVSGSSVAMIDTLAHATKNLCKVIEDGEMMDGSFAGGPYRGGSYRGGSYEGGRGGQGGGSYARGRGRNARRDSMGRYSRAGYSRGGPEDMVEELRDLMEDAPDEQTRKDIQRIITRVESM